MANQATETGFDKETIETGRVVTLEPIEEFKENTDAVGVMVTKGKREGKIQYFATINGTEGGIRGSVSAAVNKALEAVGLNPKAFAVSNSWKEYQVPRNEPEVAEATDEMKADYKVLKDAFKKEQSATTGLRKAAFAQADVIAELRAKYSTKEDWGTFLANAPEGDVQNFLQAKNLVSECVKSSAIRKIEGVTDDSFGNRVNGNRGVIMQHSKALDLIADNAVWIATTGQTVDWLGKGDFEGIDTGDHTRALYEIVKTMSDTGIMVPTVAGDGENASDKVAGGARGAKADKLELASMIADYHLGTIIADDGDGGVYDVFAVTDGELAPAQWAEEYAKNKSSKYQNPTTLGMEGADELLAALAKAWNAQASSPVSDDDTPEPIAPLAEAMKEKGFADFTLEAAARHLAHIALARGTEEDSDTLDVIDRTAEIITAVIKGEMSMADVLEEEAADTPSEDEAEEEAMADMD